MQDQKDKVSPLPCFDLSWRVVFCDDKSVQFQKQSVGEHRER